MRNWWLRPAHKAVRTVGPSCTRGALNASPRGCSKPFLTPAFCRRTSLDCSRRRKRTLTPSVRFLGPRTYVAAVLVLVGPRRRTSASHRSDGGGKSRPGDVEVFVVEGLSWLGGD